MDNEHSRPTNLGSAASARANILEEKTSLGAHSEAAFSKVSEAVQQAGSHISETATSLATQAGEKAKGVIDQQVSSGADFLNILAVRRAPRRIPLTLMFRNSPGLFAGWRLASPTCPTPCEVSLRRRCWRPRPSMYVRIRR
jgi:hypothetical protein